MAGAGTLSIRIVIEGRVQGVWYRGWTVETARAGGLSGWVRNRADGSVEALFTGPPVYVRQIVKACQEGPPAAQVTSITEFSENAARNTGFIQRPTE
jgi:acylphosphatase